MLSPLVLAGLAVVVTATTFLSGIFGLAGGIILLGVLLVFLDVVPAMLLFGVIQGFASLWRGGLLLKYVRWDIIWRYMLGSAAAFLVLRWVSFVPDKATVYLALGLLPFAADLLPRSLSPNITRPGAPYVCGGLIMVVQLLAGAAAHITDIFFQKSKLDRMTVVATKSVTQVVGHAFRIAYFGSYAAAFETTLPWWWVAGVLGCVVFGTTLAGIVLRRMTDDSHRRWTKWLIVFVSAVYLARGLWLLLEGS